MTRRPKYALQIQTKGIKEHDVTLAIKPRTLIAADNETGKSTIAEGIRFGVLGHIPMLGRTNAATAALMCGGKMEVMIELKDGRTFRRELSRGPKGVLMGATECSWLKNAKPTEHAQEIIKLFGVDESEAAEVLDIRQLLDATPNKRAERIESLLAAGQATPRQLAELIAELTTRRLADKEDEKLENWKDLIRILPKEQKEVLKKISGMLQAKVKDGGLVAALKWANDEKREATLDVKEKIQAQKELDRRIEELPKADPKKIQQLKEEHDRLQRETGAARERAAEATRKIREIEQAGDVIHDLGNAVMRAQAAVEENEETRKNLKEGQKRLAEVQKKLDQLKTPEAPDLSKVNELDQKGEELDQQAKTINLITPISTAKEQAETETLERDLKRVAESPWAEVSDLAQDIDAVIPKEEARIKKDLRRLIELAEEGMGANPDKLRAELVQAQNNLALLLDEQAEQKKKLADQDKKRRGLTTQAVQMRERADELRRKVLLEHKKKTTEYDSKRTALISERKVLRNRTDNAEAEASAVATALEKAKERHAAAKARQADLGKKPNPKAIEKERLGFQDEIDRVSRELDALSGAAIAKKELANLVERIEELTTEQTVYSAVEWAAQRAREQGIAEASGICLDTMVRFLEAAGRPERPYFHAHKGHVDIGWTKDDYEVGVQVMSGFGFALFTAALTAAVLIARPTPVRLLLVEAGEADKKNLPSLLAGIDAVADDLTASIVMTHLEPPKKAKGWHVVRLEVAEPAEAKA
jgi:DNA repair exonuclease SbcCD ATPase subunit